MKLALLSNVTVDLLAGLLKKNNDIYISSGFNTWQQELLMPTSGLYYSNPDAIVILLHTYDYEWENYDKACNQIDEWCEAFKILANNLTSIPVFISSIDVKNKCKFGAENNFDEAIESYFIKNIQEIHNKGASFYILPVKEEIVDLGRNTFYSNKMWYVGSMPYSIKGLESLGKLITRYTSITKGRKKKGLVVDLDNTLWGGVIGEDGINGIVLSNHKEGARYYDTQKLLKKIKNQGVMLAILSKNNIQDVEPVFQHPFMILQHEDFVLEYINWDSKSENIKKLAKELNIGLDSIVFLDDNPAEREQMKALCPEVSVIDFPKDSSQLPQVIEQAFYDYFVALEVTGEDTKKTAMYRAENQRKAAMSSLNSIDDFLKKLEMTMIIHKMLPEEENRVVQLINKTNQFNVTTKRYSDKEIKDLSKTSDIITIHMSDKYGEQGLVSVIILKYENKVAFIDTFLMSCRVMGRYAEFEIMSRIKDMLAKKEISLVKSLYIRSSKNSPVEELYENLGFTIIETSETEKKYEAKVSDLPDRTKIFKNVEEEII